jgi:hypothetical protein
VLIVSTISARAHLRPANGKPCLIAKDGYLDIESSNERGTKLDYTQTDMADEATIISLMGDYDNLQEPTPAWNHKEVIVGLTIPFLVR